MIIELNLAEVEAILEIASQVKKPTAIVKGAISAIKKIVKLETESQIQELDRLIKRIGDNGYKDEDLVSRLSKVKDQMQLESSKTKDKYFNSDGTEKES